MIRAASVSKRKKESKKEKETKVAMIFDVVFLPRVVGFHVGIIITNFAFATCH